MNNLSIVELVQISHAPQIVFDYPIVVQDNIELTYYEQRAMCALVCNLTGIGISKINRASRVGKVYSLDIAPFQKQDPTLLICKDMNLEKYYEIWSSAVGNRKYWNGWDYDNFRWSNSEFIEAMKTAIRSARSLSKDEVVFATIEMLHFQNEMMCR